MNNTYHPRSQTRSRSPTVGPRATANQRLKMQSDSTQTPNESDATPPIISESAGTQQAITQSDVLDFVSPTYLSEGRVVNVESRTWPGINKPGGIGRITKIYTQQVSFGGRSALKVTHIDVKFLVNGGRENKVDVNYVKHAPEYDDELEERSLRDRSALLGRCTLCKSLRIDCNACDWKAEQEVFVAEISAENKRSEDGDFDQIMNSDEEDDIALDVLARYHRLMRLRRTGRKSNRKNARKTPTSKSITTTNHNIHPDSSTHVNRNRAEESEESDEDIPLSALEKTVNSQKEEKRRSVRSQRRRNLVNPCSLASLPPSSAQFNTSNRNLSGNEPESFADRGSTRIIGTDSLSHPERTSDGICDIQKDFLDAEEHLGKPVNETNMENNNDEVEFLLTPTDDFLFDENSQITTTNGLNDATSTKRPTPTALDEKDPVQFDGNDEISFHGDPDDDDTENDSSESYSMHVPEDDSSYDQCSDYSASDEEYDDFPLMDATPDQTPKEYQELLKFIDELASEIEDTKIPYATQKLSVLKARLNLTKGRIGSSEKNGSDMTSLADESYELHKFVVEKLIREGIDQCNRAITRLCAERKANLLYYRQTRALIEQTDARLWRLNDSITAIDRNVTALQKQIQKDIDALLPSESKDASDISISYAVRQQRHHDRKRNASGTDWGPHQHASKKRKPSSRKRLNQTQKEQREHWDNVARTKKSTKRVAERATTATQNSQRPDRGERGTNRESLYVETFHVDFVGESDNIDVHQVSSRTHTNESVHRRKNSLRSYLSSENRSQGSRIYRKETGRRRMRDQSDGYTSGRTISGNSIQRRLGTSTSATSNEVRVIGLTSSSGSKPSKGHPVNAERTGVTEPPLPTYLSVKYLFQSLSNTTKIPSDDISEEISSHPWTSESVVRICDTLTSNYPDVKKCSTSLSDLSRRVLTELQDDEVAAIFNSMLTVFRKKCTTFLDLLRSDPKDARFHIRCWSLVFKMMHKKLHLKLQQEDDTTCNIFRHVVPLASHILLQMIDCFYSQLLWPEWGASPRFDSQVFTSLDKLRDRIGMVVPLLPLVADLLRSKFESQCWHRSKVANQKEHDTSELYFVSAINPDGHIQFLTGHSVSSRGCSRLSEFGRNIPRREIHALWYMIGYFSSTPTISTYLDCKHTRSILASLIQYNCGIFPKDYFPPHQVPNAFHIDTCCQEIEWTAILISSKSLGHLPDLDSFVVYLIDRAVQLNSRHEIVNSFSSLNDKSVRKILSKYWHCPGMNPDPQVADYRSCMDSFELLSLLVADERSEIWCLPPSTRLVQNCTSMLKVYAELAMSKKAKWNRLSGTVNSLISSLQKKAQECETKPNTAGQNDDFGSAFPAIDEFTCDKRFDSPHCAYFRECSSFMLLSCLIARRHSSSGGVEMALNKKIREQLLKLSSDENTLKHQMHLLETKPGNAPPCSDNLCSLFTSAKILYFVALLHLFVDGSERAPSMLESLEKHLAALGLDNDTEMLRHLVTAIVSPLLGCCDVQDSLSKDTVDSTLTCLQVIRSISMWISSIYYRASFILIALTNDNLHSFINVKVISESILEMGKANFSLFLLQSLTRALKSIVSNLPSRHSSAFECILKTTFRSCLIAMRNVIGLNHTCQRKGLLGELSEASHVSTPLYVTAFNEFRNFLMSTVLKAVSNTESRSPNRILCRDQSGSLMGVYAALCTLCLDQSDHATNEMFCPNPTATHEDKIYLKQMRACFSCELSRLSSFQGCKVRARLEVEHVLNDLVMSLVNLETLMIFPSCNVKQVVLSGGEDLRKDADMLLFAPRSVNMPYQNPDDEATLIEGIELCSDSVGPNYMIQNIWSFCEQVANLLCECHILQQGADFKGIGQALAGTCENLRSNKELLDMTPLVSFERECLKRYIVFTSLLTELVQVKGNSSGRYTDISFAAVNSIFENIYFLSEIVLYHEKQRAIGCLDKGSRFNRAKTVAYQKAYATLCGSLLALLIRENAILNNDLRTFVHNFVIRIFTAKENVRDIIEDANKKQFFDFSLRKIVNTVTISEKSYLLDMTCDIRSTFLSRADDLLTHDAHCHSKGLPTTLLHAMMIAAVNASHDGVSVDSFLTTIANALLLTPVGVMVRSPRAHSELQSAMDHYLRYFNACRMNTSFDSRAIVNYREWVLASSLATKLSTKNSLQRISLQLLTKIFETFSSKDIKSDEKVYDNSGNMASFLTYAKIARSLKTCFSEVVLSNSMDTNFMDLLETCASALLSLQVSNRNGQETSTLVLLATDQTQSEDHHLNKIPLVYIAEFSKWLKVISSIPNQDPEVLAMLSSVLKGVSNLQPSSDKQEELSGFTSQKLVDLSLLLQAMEELEATLFHERKIGKVNPYAKGRS
eukprot:CCRYP_009812-RA/>CCRYP_009812-RA protein AED:0.01 eAED:0.01 QI:43/1/1/1/0.75/0.8/5/982/2365